MNVLDIHAKIINDYATYIRSFINIRDDEIRDLVNLELEKGKLWPEPLLQFNPSFEFAGDVAELSRSGVIHPQLVNIFDKGFNLYRHQLEAISLGSNGKDFILTSGTGSGKSLTYIGSIFHSLLSLPAEAGVSAVVVYPMNALINSQYEEFNRYKHNYEKATGREFQITFGRYTGQEKEDARDKMRETPPQILLTNYMMLELILTRQRERKLRDAIYSNLRFLVFDELHTYRGRQGADVALLIRRILAKCRGAVTCAGTSATMVSGASIASAREQVASVATTLFGRKFSEEQIVNETLSRSLSNAGDVPTKEELAGAILQGVNFALGEDELKIHPVAIWLETCIALDVKDGILVRRTPQRISDTVEALARASGLAVESCRSFLSDLLQWISTVNSQLQEKDKRYTFLPFKLHQFFSQTGSVYTTLDQGAERFITLEPGVYKQDSEGKKLIFPIVFSRATGHAFICVSKIGNRLEPRDFRETADGEDDATDGYLIVGEDVWKPEEESELLPDSWFKESKRGRLPDPSKKDRFPLRLYYDGYGNCSENDELEYAGWFMKSPLLFDPTGGSFFEGQTKENTKLTMLGSEGRSTSTTIASFSILKRLSDCGFQPQDQKLLSFTDNRQDAALQAGHFNDFVQVVRLRSAIHTALKAAPENTLNYNNIGAAIFKAIALPFEEFANFKGEQPLPHVRRTYEECFQTFLLYRALADLRRSWRIILPSLEQCALLHFDYCDIAEVSSADTLWQDIAVFDELPPHQRAALIADILEYFRLEYAIHSENFLTSTVLRESERKFRELLKTPWSLDPNEKLREPFCLRHDKLQRTAGFSSKSIGANSALGKFFRHYVRQYNLKADLSGERYAEFISQLMKKLARADYLAPQNVRNANNEDVPVYRLKIDKILWRLGDGRNVRPDRVKSRSYKDKELRPNEFFSEVYQQGLANSKSLRGADHTGQLGTETRIEREDKFREGSINALFCSPTMELGIDVKGLSVVHLRNAPPNAANYAQRSGRAGRSGQGALIFTYCSSYSPHDRHYFERQSELVSGAVQTPRLDLCNKDLLASHLNALTISEIGLSAMERGEGGKPSLMSLVDEEKTLPLSAQVRKGLEISPRQLADLKAQFTRVIQDIEGDLIVRGARWYSQQWMESHLAKLADNLDGSLQRWRLLYRSAKATLTRATHEIDCGVLIQGSDEYKKQERNQRQALRQLNLLCNSISGGATELSEFYPFRYLASEGFLPGYNFTRLPLRIYLPTSDSSGEFISRPRSIALREFGPLNHIYHNGRKFRVSQMIGQEIESRLVAARVSKKAGYFLGEDQNTLEICPFTGLNLGNNDNCEHLSDLLEMSESRAEEVDRISCEEEERVSCGYDINTYFSVDAGAIDIVRKSVVKSSENDLLNLRFIPAARLVHVNTKWRKRNTEGFPIGLISGDWCKSMPEDTTKYNEDFRLIKLWTSNVADVLHIEPMQALGLKADGVVSFQYAIKRAIETIYQIEPNEIGVRAIGDPESPNILVYEAAEGSLGILSRFVEDVGAFREVVERASEICRFTDKNYTAPASYDDLLSYYNQRDHKRIDRFLIADALAKLGVCTFEIQSNAAFHDYEEHYQAMLRGLDPTSSTEKKFLQYLYNNGLRLPDAAQKRVDGMYIQPDFYYEPRIWVFCDGTPHDTSAVKADDARKRQELLSRGDEVWVYYYKDDLANKVAARPDIFKKVK